MNVFKILILLLFFSPFAQAQSGLSASYLKLTPTTLPTVCSPGTTRFDSSGHTLSLCYPANTWTAVGSGGGGGGTWGSITGTLSSQTDLQTALNLKANNASPVFSGALTSTQIATPSSPASGKDSLYFKADNNLYALSPAGQEIQIGAGMQGTPWSTSLSFTPSAGFGGVTGAKYLTRRICDELEVIAYFIPTSPTSSTMSLAMPAGYVIDSSKLSSSGTLLNSALANTADTATSQSINTNRFLTYPFFDGSDTGNIYFASQGTSGAYLKAVANAFSATSVQFEAHFKVPIVGWTCQSPAAPGQSGANMFSAVMSGLSTLNSSGSFVTFSNSPALTFTPTVTGTYKVYSSVPINNQSSNSFGTIRVFNTSGGATLLSESQASVYSSSSNPSSNVYTQSVYTLIAGTTYVFDVQGMVSAGSGIYLDATDMGPAYLYAELYAGTIGNGVTQVGTIDAAPTPSPNALTLSNNILYAQSASGTNPGMVNIGGQTFAGSKTFGTNLNDAFQMGTNASTAVHFISGGINQTINTSASNYTQDSTITDYVIRMNCSAACTVTLLAPTNGRLLRIVDVSGAAATNNITIAPNGADTINGQSNLIINVNNGSVDLIGVAGTGWNIL